MRSPFLKTLVGAAGDGVVRAAVVVRASGRGGFNSCGAGYDNVRLGQFGELAVLCTPALYAIVLVLQCLGNLVLVFGVLGLVLLGQVAQGIVLVLCLG
jgi:hypothetical protein